MPKPPNAPAKPHEPWEISLSCRLSSLTGAELRILYFYEYPDSASFRYRCYNMAQAINTHSCDARATYIFLSDLEALSNPSEYADILVVSRTRYDSRVERLVSSFRNRGKKVFFDIDDLIFDTNHAPLVASNLNFDLWGEGLDKWFSLISRMGATMKLCDAVVTTNAHLSHLAHEFSGLPTAVIPNFLNHEQLAVSDGLFEEKRKSREIDGPYRLGYFSGSKSHKKDFDVVSKSLAEVMATNPDVSFLLVGHLDLPESLRPFANRIVEVAFTDFLSLQSLIASVDLCLVPLQASIFTNSKSQLKFFEAGAVGVPTLASASPVFSEAITHHDNGYLAEPGKWTQQITSIFEFGKQRPSEAGAKARESALKSFTPETNAELIMSVISK